MSGLDQIRTNTIADSALSSSYLQLARSWSLWSEPLEVALHSVARAICAALDLDRVGIWSFNDDHSTITLRQLHDRRVAGIAQGLELNQTQLPDYFRQIRQARLLDVADLAADPRTRELRDSYSLPNRIGALLDVPLLRAGHLWGVLCIENVGPPRLWSDAEKWYAVSVADLISQLLGYEALRASEQRLRFMSDNLPVGILRTNLAGGALYANRKWQLLTGLHPAALLGQGWLQAIDPAERGRVADDLIAAVGGQDHAAGDGRGEARLIEGDNRWIAYRWVAERNSEGAPTGALGIFIDITTEKLSLLQLQENEQRYRALFESTSDALLLMGPDNRFVDCNEAAEQLLSRPRHSLIGARTADISAPLQADGRPLVEAALNRLEEAKRGERRRFEWRYLRSDGVEVECEATINRIDIGGQPHILGSARDISERRAAERELARSYRRVSWVNQLSQRLHRESNLEQIAAIAMQMLSARVPARLLRFLDRDGDWLRQIGELGPLAGKTPARAWDLRHMPLALPEGVRVQRIDVAHHEGVPEPQRQQALALGINHYLLLALVDGEMLHGGINLELADAADADAIDTEDLLAFASTLTMALVNAHHLREIEFRAEHDVLSGLPNRSVLHRELAAATAGGGEPLTLMLLDLDRFKEVNDALGHHVGDRLLCQIGPRLQEVLGPMRHLLCRLGGDEFAVLLRHTGEEGGLACARGLVQAISRAFNIDGMALQIGVSIGIACFPQHGGDGHALLRAADVAMYSAKRGGGGAALYDASLDTNTPERLALIADLSTAIDNGGLQLHYQPKIALADNRVVGFEALVRWQHPRFGLLAPAAFMPFAEVSAAIHPLTRDVLRQSLLQQQRWLATAQPAAVAVNLSARNLAQADFFDELRALLEETGADPTLLELEITETTLMHDPAGAAALLRRIAGLGVRLAIDDFGTGYSSLAYLRSLPIHALKIDRTFVGELAGNQQDAVIVRSTIALAHNLNLRVVAEGVEDAASLAQLREMGCDLAQGFYFSRPQPAPVIDQWLRERG